MKVNENMLKSEQVEISITELCKYVCARIIWILIFSFILAIFVPLLKYFNDKNALQNSEFEEEYKLQQEQLQSYCEQMEFYEQMLETEKKYKQDSVYINLDYKNINVVTLQFDIKTDENSLVDVMTAFYYYGNEGAMVKDIYELDDSLEPIYLKEVLRVTCSNYSVYDPSSVMSIRIYAESEDNCVKYAELVRQVLENYSNSLTEAGLSNEVVQMYEKYYIGQDAAIWSAQKTHSSTLIELKNNITTCETKIEELESIITDNNVPQEAIFSKKYAVVGFAVGFMVAIMVLAVRYIISNKVKYDSEFKEMTGINCIGCLSTENRNLSEKIFNTLFKSDKYRIIKEERLFCQLQALCDVNDIKKISVIGDEKVCKENGLNLINKRIKNVSLNVIGDIVQNIDAMNSLSYNDNAIFAIRINQTSYSYLEEMIKICSIKDVNVIGYICIY